MLARLDAAFEVVLGLVLLLGAVTGALDGSDFPRPVGRVLVVVAGLALVSLGTVIWSGRVSLKALALGNAISAVAGVLWLALVSGFSTLGAALVGVTVAGLACLAVAQAATLRA